ncbi:MAG: hypothetical protein AAFR96_03745 [Planctomycetota bacterium]
MTDAGSGQNGFGADDLSIGGLIRAAADGEITAEQERKLELLIESDPDVARRIESDRQLRSAVGRALSSSASAPMTAPAGLRERVAAAMATEKLVEEADERQAAGGPAADQDVPSRMAPATRDRSFWAGPASRVLAAAAALTLVATVFVVSRGSIDDSVVGSRTRAVQFVASEHGRCVADLAPGAGKFQVTAASEMPGVAGNVLGQEVTLASLIQSGVQNVSFVDAGRCHVPGGGGSMHLRFEAPIGPADAATGLPCVEQFSLFVQEDRGRLGLDDGVTYELDPSDGGTVDVKSPTVYVWARGGLVYYLVVNNAAACGELRQQLSVPETVRDLTNAA